MITFLIGVPGSGKSYFAVDKIYNNFSADEEAIRDKNSTFEICYTNINEFNFTKVKNVYKLDFDDLKIKLTELHKYYKDKKDDEFLVEKCKEYDIHNALFVIDEAHNFFDVKDVVLIWWLSYHRHLFHEIILITQNLSLIESKYKSFSEFFYKAYPQSLTLIKTHFKYNVYCSSRMSLNSKSGSIKIKRNKKVFELYKSGDSINAQNVILKFLIFGVVILFLLVGLFYWFISSKTPDNPIADDVNVTAPQINNYAAAVSSSPAPAPVYESVNPQERKFFNLTCNNTNCYNEDILLPLPLLEYFIKNKSMTFFHSVKINKNSSRFYLDSTNDFYKYISNKRRKNEDFQSSNNPVSVDSMFSGK